MGSLTTVNSSGRVRRLNALRTALPAALALLLAIVIAIAGAGSARADAFDRTWCEIDAGAFRLVTDYPEAEAQALIRQMLAFRPVAENFLPGVPNDDQAPLTVLVFQRRGDIRRAIGGGEMLGYMLPAFNQSMLVVGPDPNARTDYESLLHEYVHYLLRVRVGLNIPTWFDEGMAGLLATVRFEPGDGDWQFAVVGEMQTDLIDRAVRETDLTLGQVIDGQDIWEWPLDRRRGFYAWSHVLVHRLMLGQAAGLPDYGPATRDSLAADAPSLLATLDVSASRLQRDLDRYRRRPPTVEVALSGSPPGAGAATAYPYRCLDADEATIELAMAIAPMNPDRAARQLEERLQESPEDPGLWTALSAAESGRGERDAAVAAARRALELAPEDVSAEVQLASALAGGCVVIVSEECWQRWREAVPLLRHALRQDPRRQDAIFILGLAYLYTGRPGDALNYLRIAHARQPWAPHLNFYLGESYRLIGAPQAEAYLDRAWRWSPVELWRKLAEAALELE